MIVVIVNTGAGSARDARAPEIDRSFRDRGAAAIVRVVAGGELARTAQQALDSGATAIVAAGGDGTVSTIASVLAGRDAALGVLPLGTMNHFAKDLQVPQALEEAVETVVRGHTVHVDMGDVNGRTFLNNSSIGVYPSLVAERERAQSVGHGKLVSHALALVRVWKRYPLVVVRLRDGSTARTVRTPFVFVGNGEYVLDGIKLTRRKSLSAGRLHVCLAPGISRLEGIRMVAAAIAGRLHQIDDFESFLDTELGVDVPRAVAVSLDGEVTVLESPLLYRVRPGVLRVIAPAAG